MNKYGLKQEVVYKINACDLTHIDSTFLPPLDLHSGASQGQHGKYVEGPDHYQAAGPRSVGKNSRKSELHLLEISHSPGSDVQLGCEGHV